MFVFTLMQSHTHVDTVQTVLECLANWRDICWSHTMKVLGSYVSFVSSSSLHVVNWSDIHFDVMKMWSRMFAVNVQSVSVQQLNWDLIVWFTQTTNSFVVFYVADILNTKIPLRDILSDVIETLYWVIFSFQPSEVTWCCEMYTLCLKKTSKIIFVITNCHITL